MKRKLWIKESDIQVIEKQNKIIINWSKYVFSVYLLFYLRFGLNLIYSFWMNVPYSQGHFLWITAVFWITLYIKLFSTPEILFGFELLQKKAEDLKKLEIKLDHIWILEVDSSKLNKQEKKLKQNIDSLIKKYIIEIENLYFNSDFFYKTALQIDDLALKMNVPKSHLAYLFKYHSNLSFVDFKKIVRIKKAAALIEEDYLKNSTLESLATEVGFSSYSPFFNSFKSITGLAPQDYYKNINL